MDQDYQLLKIVVIGDSGTGKTNIALQFTKQQFNTNHNVTVGVQFLTSIITINNIKFKVMFWDTAGQERFRSISKQYYKGASGIILVYDITDPQSYIHLQSWLKIVYDNINMNEAKLILIGNKIDLQEKRKVSFDRVKQQYQKQGIYCFETSAKTGQGINQSIMFLIQKIYDMTFLKNGEQSKIQKYGDSGVFDSLLYERSLEKSKLKDYKSSILQLKEQPKQSINIQKQIQNEEEQKREAYVLRSVFVKKDNRKKRCCK